MASSKNSGREKIFEAKLTKYETWLFENHCSIYLTLSEEILVLLNIINHFP